MLYFSSFPWMIFLEGLVSQCSEMALHRVWALPDPCMNSCIPCPLQRGHLFCSLFSYPRFCAYRNQLIRFLLGKYNLQVTLGGKKLIFSHSPFCLWWSRFFMRVFGRSSAQKFWRKQNFLFFLEDKHNWTKALQREIVTFFMYTFLIFICVPFLFTVYFSLHSIVLACLV